tara:strand:+ start:19 stop:315 length:297 start_codon:yes stop_codon:yes gene_type:complete
VVLFGCDVRKHGNLLHHGTVAGRMDPIPSGTADTTGTAGTVGTVGNAGTSGRTSGRTTGIAGTTFSGVFDEPCRVLQLPQDEDMGADSVIELHCGQRS